MQPIVGLGLLQSVRRHAAQAFGRNGAVPLPTASAPVRSRNFAHRRCRWVTKRGWSTQNTSHEKGHRNPGLEMAKSELAPPTTHSRKRSASAPWREHMEILGNQKIQYMQTRKVVDRCQTNRAINKRNSEVGWYVIEARGVPTKSEYHSTRRSEKRSSAVSAFHSAAKRWSCRSLRYSAAASCTS